MEYFPYILLALFIAISVPQWWVWYSSRKLRGRHIAGLDGGRRLYYFYSQHCPPCRQFAPTIDAFAERHPGEVVKVDVGVDGDTARRFGIRGTPTLAVVDGETLVEVKLGSVSPQRLEQMLRGDGRR